MTFQVNLVRYHLLLYSAPPALQLVDLPAAKLAERADSK